MQVLSRPTAWLLDVVGQIQGYIEWYWYGTWVVSIQSAVQVLVWLIVGSYLIVGCYLVVGYYLVDCWMFSWSSYRFGLNNTLSF